MTDMSSHPSAGGRPLVTPRALVIEDTDDIRRVEVLALQAAGWTVIDAGTGAEGLDRASGAEIDVIILDLELPDMDGLTVMTALKDDPSTAAVPVVMVTARAGTGATVRGLVAGAHDYLTKPFDAHELCARASAALRHRRNYLRMLELDRLPSREAGSAVRFASGRTGQVLDQMPGSAVLVFDGDLVLELASGPLVAPLFGPDPHALEGQVAAEVSGIDAELAGRVADAARGTPWSGYRQWNADTFIVDVAPLRAPTGALDGVVLVVRTTPL